MTDHVLQYVILVRECPNRTLKPYGINSCDPFGMPLLFENTSFDSGHWSLKYSILYAGTGIFTISWGFTTPHGPHPSAFHPFVN